MRSSSNIKKIAVNEELPIIVSMGQIALRGTLCIPPDAKGLVIFAHGSGSSRLSPRNRYVAEILHQHTVGTLLIDLLTKEEEQIDQQTRELRFNIPLLAKRLINIAQWVSEQDALQALKIGYFGASTGAAAALIAAAQHSENIAAIVSRGGRPDLAMDFLPEVKAPTLLLVGEFDAQVALWNQKALEKLNTESRLYIIPRATHLFEEPGALEEVAQLSAHWFASAFSF